MNLKIFDILNSIAKKLNEEKITLAAGASILLNHYRLIDKPVTCLEDWYVLYHVIPNRNAKVKMI